MNELKKRIYGILLGIVVISILYLTFQDSVGTVRLSEGIRFWVERFGIKSDFHSFRSNAHLIVFFAFGTSLSMYGREKGWRIWTVLLIGCSFGLIDEVIKVVLPTREFDVIDLIKNWIGVVAGVGIISILFRLFCGKDVTDNGKTT